MKALVSAAVYTTAKDTPKRLSPDGTVALTSSPPVTGPILRFDTERRRQTILGFGGAFTEAMADTLRRVSPATRRAALDAYFHPERGIGYSFCRTHINSCDFSLENYSYDDVPGDMTLAHFDISRDETTLIPLIREATAVRGAPITLFASPWSPPGWMKTTGRMNHGGSLKREYYQVWADYFVRYILAYRERGVPIWGVTVQNEPLAVTPWDNCVYTHAEEREFVKVLGRTLRAAGLGEVRILVWDHNKDFLRERADVIFADLEAYDYVWGVGFHWYSDRDTNSVVDNQALYYVHKNYPDKPLVFTEGCNPVGRGRDLSDLLGAWWTGEKYARHIIADLNHYTVAWTDWNMVLDERGGPNHVGNFCDAPIIADTIHDRLIFESPYYYLGHFSKFIAPGAVCFGVEGRAAAVQAVAAENPSGEVVLVALNTADRPERIPAVIADRILSIDLPPHAIRTYVISDEAGSEPAACDRGPRHAD